MNLRCKGCGGKSENLVDGMCEYCISRKKKVKENIGKKFGNTRSEQERNLRKEGM